MEFETRMQEYRSFVEEYLRQFYSIFDAQPQKPLYDAMRYSLLAGGKRLRNGGEGNRIERDQQIDGIELGNFAAHVLAIGRKAGPDAGGPEEIAGQKTAEHKKEADGRDRAEPLGIIEKIPVSGMQDINIEESERAQKLHLIQSGVLHNRLPFGFMMVMNEIQNHYR